MMPTCSVQTHINNGAYRINAPDTRAITRNGFTMTELIVVVVMVSMFVLLAHLSLTSLFRKSTFKAQAQELVSTMQLAVTSAAESDRRYEVIINLIEQNYTLRQITSSYLPSDVMEEEIIIVNELSDNCRAVYVLFDDLIDTDENHQEALFRAGRAGWQNGGKIILLDEDENFYSIVINRMNRIVTLKEGDVELLMPKAEDEMRF